MNLRLFYIFTLFIILFFGEMRLGRAAEVDKNDLEYQMLRDSMTYAFNTGDSTRFFVAVGQLEQYLLRHDDLHGYYTQRCNEIVFLLNHKSIFEAYKLSMQLSKELRQRKLDSELYMAINMMGHIYKYCGNDNMARQNFREVLRLMEKYGYYESMPPIYMNLVQVEADNNPKEALRLMETAARLADSVGRRRFDIDAYRTIYAFKTGDMAAFMKGYQAYKEGKEKGQTSVHGLALEAYYLLSQGDVKGAIEKTKERQSPVEAYDAQTFIYESVGDWKGAYEALQHKVEASDSVNSAILINSMQGIQNELAVYEAERMASHQRFISLVAMVVSMIVIIAVLFVYSFNRRRYIRQLREARDRALESDRMKTAFISNISHEIRTPLNIISGFMQVMNSQESDLSPNERMHITSMIIQNTNLITQLVDELLDLSIIDSSSKPEQNDQVRCNDLCREVLSANQNLKSAKVEMLFESDFDDHFEILTNRGMLRKILNALLDNAVKYTSEGQVRFMVRQQPSSIAFVVEDTGCGIPLSEAERIFERFEKLDAFKSGLGLGLSLARTLAQLLGGSLTLDTSYANGARFVVQVPLP